MDRSSVEVTLILVWFKYGTIHLCLLREVLHKPLLWWPAESTSPQKFCALIAGHPCYPLLGSSFQWWGVLVTEPSIKFFHDETVPSSAPRTIFYNDKLSPGSSGLKVHCLFNKVRMMHKALLSISYISESSWFSSLLQCP